MEEKTAEEKYVEYVLDFIEEYKRQTKLIDRHDMILPSFLNRAIGEYGSHSATLTAEYARLAGYLSRTNRQYKQWWDKVFLSARTKLYNERTGTKTISVKEIESTARVDNESKYEEFNNAIEDTQLKLNFIGDLISFWKKQDNMLNNLSYNMRSELKSLSVQDRANGKTEQEKDKDVIEEKRSRRKLKD